MAPRLASAGRPEPVSGYRWRPSTAVGPILRHMSAAYDFELLPHAGVPAEEVEAAEHGQLAYLTRNGEPVAAIEALEDAEDIRAARAALADREPDIHLEELLTKYTDDLTAYPDER
jgi:antitoxin (DNA-binding transcriptional repressor) of toxin-antitoxin stability system